MRGGARNRSGPQPSESSGRSDRRGFSLLALPAEGRSGEPPEFPLPAVKVFDVYFQDKQRIKEYDPDSTQARRERELALWGWAWGTPQACAWEREPWRWQAVAMWVRTSVLCESAEATAADKNSLHRFADQIGLTPAGLKENGWKIAVDEVATRRAEQPRPEGGSVRADLKSRMAIVDGSGA